MADFWIVNFLDARLAVSDQAATLLLANVLKRTHENLEDPMSRMQIFAAAVALKTNSGRRWTFQRLAREFFDDEVQKVFLGAIAAGNIHVTQAFGLDTDILDRQLNFRAFELETGVLVSAPFAEVGQSVKVEQSHLSVAGTIRSDHIKGRR